MSKLFIIIPTYNEVENIESLIQAIELNLAPLQNNFQILIIDDNSPDGTAARVDQLIKTSKIPIQIIKRKGKLGLGSAYIEGYKFALKNEADFIIGMDADFSHDPVYLKDIYRELQQNDVVIGSRYVKGGGVLNWSWNRRLLSRLGSIYARLILNWPVKDPTTAYVGYKRKVLETINLDAISGVGYYFLIEMKYMCFRAGFKIKETPIIFPDRVKGKSKMNSEIIGEAITSVLKLRLRK